MDTVTNAGMTHAKGCSGLNGIMQAQVAQGLCAAVVRIVSLERGAERSSSELNWTNRVGGLKASQFETVRQGWLHSLEPGWRAALWATRTNMRLPVPISMRSPVRGLC